MAVNPIRRQRKLEKKRAERKAQKKAIARRQSGGVLAKFREAGTGRVLHCEYAPTIWTHGIGQVWISRELHGGWIGYVSILVDVHCLGVKDGLGRICSRPEYYEQYTGARDQLELTPFSIECARKLVEGSVAYAAEADIAPHPDYDHLRLIFGDADASACPTNYEYGHDGKPFFSAGPYDSPSRCAEIMSKLQQRYGENGFHYMMRVSKSDLSNLEVLDDGDGLLLGHDEDADEQQENSDLT